MRLQDTLPHASTIAQVSTLPIWASLAREAPLTVLYVLTTVAIIHQLRPIVLKWLDWEGTKEVERMRHTPPASAPAIASTQKKKRKPRGRRVKKPKAGQ